jgi:hypothetical protein
MLYNSCLYSPACIVSPIDLTSFFPFTQNQKIRTLAREVDPSGNRSIGVLTKPDKIEADTEGTTIDILLDRKYELRYGYFVVRTPKQAELNNILTAMASKESFDKVSKKG